MQVAVLGAGVVGVTTAYYLAEAGHDVTVIDREDAVAQGCSFANGAQLSYSYTDAMANPAFLLKMPHLLAGFDRAIRLRPPMNAALMRWSMNFLGECTAARATGNTLANLHLAHRSRQLIGELRNKLDAKFAYRKAGKIILLHTEKERTNAVAASHFKAELGCATRVIDIDEAVGIEPAIKHMTGEYAGAVYSSGDDVGDARAFTAAVAAHLHGRTDCRFELGTTVSEIVTERGRVRAINTDKGALEVNRLVVCAGAWSSPLLRPLGIDPGIIPARGYSVTLDPGKHAASVSVTDFAKRFVVSRLNDKVRIAGFADFVGYETSKDEQRVAQLLGIAQRNAPDVANYNSADNHAWGGFRPLTANGRPRIGATTVDGLFLNTGHGSLGWTLACASAEQVVTAIAPEKAEKESLAA